MIKLAELEARAIGVVAGNRIDAKRHGSQKGHRDCVMEPADCGRVVARIE